MPERAALETSRRELPENVSSFSVGTLVDVDQSTYQTRSRRFGIYFDLEGPMTAHFSHVKQDARRQDEAHETGHDPQSMIS